MSDAVLDRWTQAGAQSGWQECFGFFGEWQCDPEDLPTFYFSNQSQGWKPGALAGLPDPEMPFALQVSNDTTDDDLPPLLNLKSLVSLTMGLSKVTDRGMKLLTGLPQLQKAASLRHRCRRRIDAAHRHAHQFGDPATQSTPR
jgi:hypothetical protein